MTKRSKILFAISAVTILSGGLSLAQSKKELLEQLDKTIAEADDYVSAKLVRIKTIENTLHSRGVSKEKQYEIYGELFDEYQPFNYTKAVETLEQQKKLAETFTDKSKLYDLALRMAMINTAAGEFLKAKEIMDRIDTAKLNNEELIEYCNVQQRFWYDYDETQKHTDPMMRKKVRFYRDKLLSMSTEGSLLSQHINVLKSFDDENYAQADFLNRNNLMRMNANTHEYANSAYYQARICEGLERREDMENWFIRSAIADIKTATKDNASLISLAKELFKDGDLEHAFRYTQFSLDDAISYDAKLRQWQIAAIMPAIQKGYSDYQTESQKKARQSMILMCILAVILFIMLVYLFILFKQQMKSTRKIKEMNAKIQESSQALAGFNSKLKKMNSELTEANAAKEQYIGLFLTMCSGYIDKIKASQSRTRKMILAGEYGKIMEEASSQKMIDDELKEFYNTFDEAFLKLYPKFVEQFNSLLNPDSRIELKNGKLLNTELRIFALIRLGITQSSDIAAMLRYSVNTIYNYRAQIKNAAMHNRDNFEETVAKIGK